MRRLAAGVALALFLTGCAASAQDTGQYRDVPVTLGDFDFGPNEWTFKKGEQIRFVLTNEGAAIHEMKIRGVSAASQDIYPGRTDEVRVTFKKTGKFQVVCDVADHRQRGMIGTIRVED